MIDFKNKNILITGASGGIGNELVKKFVSLGGNVLGTGTKTEKLDLLKKKEKKRNYSTCQRTISLFFNEKSSRKYEKQNSKYRLFTTES